jgi:general secretion pathway protein A
MYLQFYNLKSKPFEISTNPKFLWLGEKHKEALATLEYGISEDKGFLLLTGDVGTGKTVLIAGLAQKLEIQTSIATIPDPGLDTLDFFNTLALSFKMGRKFDSKGDFLNHLRKFLLKAAADNRKVLLIIDEAQRLDNNLLEEIRLLSNIELQDRKLINIFFVGQPEFNTTLAESRNKAVRHRIAVRYHIEPLTLDEMDSYIKHRLKVAGTTRKIFSHIAVREIFAFSGGNPRLTNIICDHALLSGYSADLKIVNDTVIRECRAELKLPDEGIQIKKKAIETDAASKNSIYGVRSKDLIDDTTRDRRPFTAIAAFILFAIIAVIGGYFLLVPAPEEDQTWSIKDMVPPTPEEFLSNKERDTLNDEAAESAGERIDSPERLAETDDDRDEADSEGKLDEEKSPNLLKPEPEEAQTGSTKDMVAQLPEGDLSDSEQDLSNKEGDTFSAEAPESAGELKDSPEKLSETNDIRDEAGSAETLNEDKALNLADIQKIVIHFNHNSNELPSNTYRALDRFAVALIDNPDFVAVVRGYTDSTGSRSYNVSVSEFRANIIKSYLVGKGVSPSRINASGKGPDDPIAPNNTVEGRRQNRRVEIEFIAKNSSGGGVN